MIRLTDIKISIDKAADLDKERQALRKKILSLLRISDNELLDYAIFKKSIDARKKQEIYYVYTVDAEVSNEKKWLERDYLQNITATPDMSYQNISPGTEKLMNRPVIIGTGPAGLFAALMLAKNGYQPLILERGEDVDNRTANINKFWLQGRLDPESNVQFGEGGAGTFSDGKLTTLIHDKRCRIILEEFIKAGAPPEIIYKNKPHIGTDILKETVKNIRQMIIEYGGEVRFKAKVTDFVIEDGLIKGIVVNDIERLACSVVLLAIGHSARDTFAVLNHRGIEMKQKPFSIGVRIEHPQGLINNAQYGQSVGKPGLEASDYKLVYHGKNGRSAYTFCMCPGGYVVAAASEEQGVVTNGMSEYRRDGINANAAILVGVSPEDFPGTNPLAGIEFQRKWEGLAYKMGGESYKAPVQLTGDFLHDKLTTSLGSVEPTYKPGVVFAQLKDCLPDYVADTLKEAILHFDTRIKGFAMPDSILTGVETRSSSPVRVIRDENHSSNIKGLYPMGEGAGYAGGIMSSAVDGVKTAEMIIARYAPIKKPS